MQHLSKTRMSEYDLEMEEENSVGLEAEAENEDHDSDEDTEDASETDMVKQEEEYTEIKEQMYQDKLANLKKQLQQLEDGTHPEYLRRLKKLEQAYQDRILLNEVFQSYEIERVEREYINEKKAAVRDFEEKKIELRENLIAELEEKKRLIEAERSTMELTGAINRHIIGEYVTDSMEVKPVTTRKLRRRPNDPLPLPEKRRKTSPTQLNYLLEENEILEDLKVINRGKLPGGNKRQEREIRSMQRQSYMQNSGSASDGISSSEHCGTSTEVRVEDGKLYYDKKWFHRGQPVYYEGKEAGTRNSGVIGTISSSEIWIKRAADGAKIRIYISQLQKGKFTIRRRSS